MKLTGQKKQEHRIAQIDEIDNSLTVLEVWLSHDAEKKVSKLIQQMATDTKKHTNPCINPISVVSQRTMIVRHMFYAY